MTRNRGRKLLRNMIENLEMETNRFERYMENNKKDPNDAIFKFYPIY